MVDGETKISRNYFDEDSGTYRPVEMTIKDHLIIKCLMEIANKLRKTK